MPKYGREDNADVNEQLHKKPKIKSENEFVPLGVSNKSSENTIFLARKRSVNNQHIVTIFADDAGNIKATITGTDGISQQAFFVRGLNSRIDLENEELVHWLSNELSENCYFTVTEGNVHVNIRLEGGYKHKFFTFAFGVGQIVLGAKITMASGGAGAPFVSGLLSSGLNTMAYALTTKETEINYSKCLKQGAASFTMGAAFGLAPSAATAGATGSMLKKTASYAISGALRPIIHKKIITPVFNGEIGMRDIGAEGLQRGIGNLRRDIRLKDLAIDAVSGAVGGSVSNYTSALAVQAVEAVSREAQGPIEAAIYGGVAGGLVSAASAAGTKLISNGVERKLGREKALTDGVSETILQAGMMGAAVGAMQSTVKYNFREKQKSEQRTKEKEAGEKEDKKRKSDRAKKMNKIAEKNGIQEKIRKNPETSGQGRQSMEQKLSKDEQSHRQMRREQAKEADLIKRKYGMKPKSRRALEAEIKELDESRLTSTQGKPIDVFFTEERLRKLEKELTGQGIDIKDLKEVLMQVEQDTLYKIYENPKEGSLSLYDRISKQLGHIRGESGHEYTSPSSLLGAGRIVVPEGARADIDLPNAVVTDLQGNIPGESIKHKIYAHCIALCESTEARNDALIQTISDEYRNYRKESISWYDYWMNPTGTVLQLTSNYLEHLKKLPEGGKAILSSGWSGHSTAHLFEKHNGQITIKIYNGGAGSGLFHTEFASNPEFVHPYSFKPVSVTSPTLSEYISSLLINQRNPDLVAMPAMYQPKGLEPAADQTQSAPMPVQPTGNCSWHNVTAAQSAILQDSSPGLIMKEEESMRQLRLSHQGYPIDHLERELELPPTTEYAVRFSPAAPHFSKAPRDPGFAQHLKFVASGRSSIFNTEDMADGEPADRRQRREI